MGSSPIGGNMNNEEADYYNKIIANIAIEYKTTDHKALLIYQAKRWSRYPEVLIEDIISGEISEMRELRDMIEETPD